MTANRLADDQKGGYQPTPEVQALCAAAAIDDKVGDYHLPAQEAFLARMRQLQRQLLHHHLPRLTPPDGARAARTLAYLDAIDAALAAAADTLDGDASPPARALVLATARAGVAWDRLPADAGLTP